MKKTFKITFLTFLLLTNFQQALACVHTENDKSILELFPEKYREEASNAPCEEVDPFLEVNLGLMPNPANTFKYSGKNSGLGAYIGAFLGGGFGSMIGSGTPVSWATGFLGGMGGAFALDEIEGITNDYTEGRWNNKKDNSTSWRSID